MEVHGERLSTSYQESRVAGPWPDSLEQLEAGYSWYKGVEIENYFLLVPRRGMPDHGHVLCLIFERGVPIQMWYDLPRKEWRIGGTNTLLAPKLTKEQVQRLKTIALLMY